jgi:two-component system response regulator DegU
MIATPIQIVIVDDSRLYRNAICTILQKKPNLQVVAEAEDGLAAIMAVEKHRPRVVLMDINMPVLNGFDATRIITTRFPGTYVIVLTVDTDETFSERAYKAGARRFLAKDCGKETLFSAIMDCAPGAAKSCCPDPI